RDNTAVVELEKRVRSLKEKLARRQGNDLDRFALKGLSPLELKHRQEHLEKKIESLAHETNQTRADWTALLASAPIKLSEQSRKFLNELIRVVPTASPHRYILFLLDAELSEVKLRLRQDTSVLPKEIEHIVSTIDSVEGIKKAWAA